MSDGAGGRSGERSGRLRPLSVSAAERPDGPAVRDARATTRSRRTSGMFVRDFIATNDHPSAWNADKPNLLETRRQRPRSQGLQHTISSGLDYVVSQNLFSLDALLVPAHVVAPAEQRPNMPTWATFGVKPGSTRTGTVPGSGLPGRRAVERRVHRRVPRRHAVALAGLRLDEGLAQHFVRRLLDAPARGRRRDVSVQRQHGVQRHLHERHEQRQRRVQHGRLRARPARNSYRGGGSQINNAWVHPSAST